MKQILQSVFVLFLLLLPFSSLAQDEGTASATITTEYCVSLSADEPLNEFYVIDISHLHFEDELDAINRFGFISNNLLTYTVDYASNKAYLHLHLDRTSTPEDLVWWTAYVDSLCGL